LAGAVNEAALDEKLAHLEEVRDWSPRLMSKLEALLTAPDDYTVLRVNPLAFAKERGVAPAEAFDLFLHATKLGIFTLDWHLLCPFCGAAVESFASLRVLHDTFFCALCALRSTANLDDYIQVSFTAAPAVRRLKFHDVDTLSAHDFLFQLRFTREMRFGALDGPRLAELMPKFVNVLTWVNPGETVTWSFDAGVGELAAAEFQAHTGVTIKVTDDAPADEIELTIAESTLDTTRQVARAGTIRGTVTNQRAYRSVFAIAFHSAEELAMGPPPSMMEPFITGAMVLANQTFRRLFRGEVLDGNEGLGVRDVSILFTDLKSSTALYERIGDLKAFTLVQRHFERLGAVVARHGGAIVKTIGDAVMAAFTKPAHAVAAALEMQRQIDAFNTEHGGRDVVLKIGIHRGPSIAVTLNDSLDYFGHTVNVAARVQGLADADEIFITDDVLRGDGVASLVTGVECRDASLRGIEKQVRVHKVTRAPSPGR